VAHSEGLVYPPDCVDRLLKQISEHDEKDPPEGKYAKKNNRIRDQYRPWPSRDQLHQLLDVALSASQEPEEGGLRRFSIAYVPPRGVVPDRYDACRFAKPKELNPRNIAKVAPAADPRRSYIGVWLGNHNKGLEIWGLVHRRKGPLMGEAEGDKSAYMPFDHFLVIRVHGPGVFLVNHNTRLHLAYVRGRAYWSLDPARLLHTLRVRAGVQPPAAVAISNVVARMVELGKGGTLLITDPARKVDATLLDLGYRFASPCEVFRLAVEEELRGGFRADLEARVRSLSDFVANLTTVDGAVHLTSDLRIFGFGGKVMRGLAKRTKLTKADADTPDDVQKASLDKDYRGMRHRSAAQFCSNQKGQALAIVVSQDGDVTLVGRRDDGVVHKIGPFALGIGVAM
jgi:hypothetical protein